MKIKDTNHHSNKLTDLASISTTTTTTTTTTTSWSPPYIDVPALTSPLTSPLLEEIVNEIHNADVDVIGLNECVSEAVVEGIAQALTRLQKGRPW
jgi:hypothetical protein